VGAEALEKARKDDKPILPVDRLQQLPLVPRCGEEGHSRNPEIARYMNEHFVNVKVDREERPTRRHLHDGAADVLRRHRLAARGRLPLSIFLTPTVARWEAEHISVPTTKRGAVGFPALIESASSPRCATTAKTLKKCRHSARRRAGRGAAQSQPHPVALERPQIDAVSKTCLLSYDNEPRRIGFSPRPPDKPKFPQPQLALFAI